MQEALKKGAIYMSKETNEKLNEKRSRYSSVSIIMRQLYGSKLAYLPGYILLQDVIYKHLEKGDMSIDDLVAWAAKKFTFSISQEDAYEEILQVVTQNLPELEEEPENDKRTSKTKYLLQNVVREATDLYEKQTTYAAISEAVREMKFPDSVQSIAIVEQDVIKILFEIKRGKTLEEAIYKIAEEEAEPGPHAKREERKAKIKERLRNTILLVFPSEMEMLEFAETIE